jgi:hypothetical protein
MITVVAAVLLLVVGLALVFLQPQVTDFVRGLPLTRDLMRQVTSLIAENIVAWVVLAASPILLIVGSLFRGI